MADFENSPVIPKKYYRYFLKALAYYTCHLNKACTLHEIQAFVFLKSLRSLNEQQLTFLSEEVMERLLSAEIACESNGYYRLNELLRFLGEPSPGQSKKDRPKKSSFSSGPAELRKKVHFSEMITTWPRYDDEVLHDSDDTDAGLRGEPENDDSESGQSDVSAQSSAIIENESSEPTSAPLQSGLEFNEIITLQ